MLCILWPHVLHDPAVHIHEVNLRTKVSRSIVHRVASQLEITCPHSATNMRRLRASVSKRP